MTVNNLSSVSFDEILSCFLAAFEGYYVKMPTDKSYYQTRWGAAKVDFNASYGMFDEGKLVGFIIHAIDKRSGVLTAFNTGTGVIPTYRGKRIVKSIYDYALKDLRQKGIEKSTLEVITDNVAAIRAYESVGFKISKRYECYAGSIQIENASPYTLKSLDIKAIDWEKLPNQQYYSWDFQKETILERNYYFYQVLHEQEPESYFIYSPETQYLAQFDLLNRENRGWDRLFTAIKQVSDSVKVINVDDRLKEKLDQLHLLKLKNTVNQYEMELDRL